MWETVIFCFQILILLQKLFLTQVFIKSYNDTVEDSVVMSNDEPDDETSWNICEISSLNDDTLLHIFSFLNMKDVITIERGMLMFLHNNKQWKQITFKGSGGFRWWKQCVHHGQVFF